MQLILRKQVEVLTADMGLPAELEVRSCSLVEFLD
jgi:hypothetical protein